MEQGDRVYAINFTYHGNAYTNYIVCSYESKKVVWNNLFWEFCRKNKFSCSSRFEIYVIWLYPLGRRKTVLV